MYFPYPLVNSLCHQLTDYTHIHPSPLTLGCTLFALAYGKYQYLRRFTPLPPASAQLIYPSSPLLQATPHLKRQKRVSILSHF